MWLPCWTGRDRDELCNYSAPWSDLGFGSPSSSVAAGGVGTSAASPGKQTRNRSERQDDLGQQFPSQNPHVWLKHERLSGAPQVRWHFHAHFSNFRRPRHRNLIGYCRGEADKRSDVERSARSLLLHAILCWRYVTLQQQMFVQHS